MNRNRNIGPDLGEGGSMLDNAAADVLRDGPFGTHMIRVSMYAEPDQSGVALPDDINTDFRPQSLRPPPAPRKEKKTKKGGRKKKSKTSRRLTKRKRGKKLKSSKRRL